MGLLDRWRRSGSTQTPNRSAPSEAPRHELQARPIGAQASFAVVDIETTGLSARSDRILELAVIRTDGAGRELDEWTSRFNPQGPVGATHIHGIVDADVAHAPLFGRLVPEISARLRGLVVVGHNVRFDLAFLRAEYARAGWSLPFLPSLCTLDASYALQPLLPSHRLGDCCCAAGIPFVSRHVAIEDARATTGLLGRYLAHGYAPPFDGALSGADAARSRIWPEAPGRARSVASRPLTDRARLNMARPRRPAPALASLLTDFPLVDALDEGAPEGSLSYLHLLADALQDGVLTDQETSALEELARVYELSADAIAATHTGLVLAMAHLALDDGRVTRDERQQLLSVCSILDVSETILHRLLDRAEVARNARLSADLQPLPSDWDLGEPLRVGDKVVFTGCEDAQRDELEKHAERLGVRVLNAVSARTAMLVSDGSFHGTKADEAIRLGTRVVTPEAFSVLLKHLQPARQRTSSQPSHVRLPRQPEPRATGVLDGCDPARVRAWARENGLTVGDRGRLPTDLIEAYRSHEAVSGPN